MPLNSISSLFIRIPSVSLSSTRIKAFLDLNEIKAIESNCNLGEIIITNANFSWNSSEGVSKSMRFTDLSNATIRSYKLIKDSHKEEDEDKKNQQNMISKIILKNVQLNVKNGEFVAIVGEIGSGKSTLISSIIGESVKNSGEVQVNGKIAMVSQNPWIVNGTIKQNVIMYDAYDESKFSKIINLCELQKDIEILPNKLETEIGSRGINLSGGQKQRISLARALYSNPDILIADDCFASFDAHVASAIYRNVILEYLNKKTRILVTNSLHLLSDCKHIIVMKDGSIVENGEYRELLEKKGEFARLLQIKVGAEEEKIYSKKAAVDEESTEKSATTNDGHLIVAEKQKIGGVQSKHYFRLMGYGGFFLGMCAIILYILSSAQRSMLEWWLGQYAADTYQLKPSTYIKVNLVMVVIFTCLMLLRTLVFNLFIKNLSFNTLIALLKSVLKCPISWFDVTPTGRILNRLIKDQDTIDSRLPFMLNMTAKNIVVVIIGMISICITIPKFVFALGFVCSILFYIYIFSIPACRDSKRIHSIMKSPIFSKSIEVLEGISTIRAQSYIEGIRQQFYEIVDNYTLSNLFNCSCQRWINLRVGILGDVMIGIAVLFACILKSNSLAALSLAGFAITKAMHSINFIGRTLRGIAESEQDMSSFERVVEYIEEIPSENCLENCIPPMNWPTEGHIKAVNISLKYRPTLDFVIKDVSFEILPLEKVGIVGRTGAGKSTLSLAMLRIIEINKLLCNGNIAIDGIDISTISLNVLRSRIAIIPQDSVLFGGTVKENIDPFGNGKESEIMDSLEKVGLDLIIQAKSVKSKEEVEISLSPNSKYKILEYIIEDSGTNFSAGEKQLFCIARAIMRKPKILIMDEATSSIDEATDTNLQRMIKSEFKYATIITIAHRLKTVADYDKIIVMDQGKIVECGATKELATNKNSEFYKLILEGGQSYANEIFAKINKQ